MSHYFEDIVHSEEDYFTMEDYVNNKKYTFQSCNNVFSKNEIDYGSQVLIRTIIKAFKTLGKNVLDIGCGYGAIGITLADYYKNTQFVLSDITKTAVKLVEKNLILNHITNAKVVESDLFNNISDTFDFIVSNPPIKIGKQVLLNLIDGAFNHLEVNGKLVLVIKKSHGKDSIKEKMKQVFNNCEILEREKGYYILNANKEK